MDALDHDISDEHALLVVHTVCEGLLIQDEREKFCIFQGAAAHRAPQQHLKQLSLETRLIASISFGLAPSNMAHALKARSYMPAECLAP